MNPWIYVICGGAFETVWAACLKESNQFTEPIWLIPMLVSLVISTVLLNKGLSNDLPSGSAYSVWVGIGAVGSLLAGIILFDENISFIKILLVVLILVGVMGIEHEQSKTDKS